MRGGIVSKHNHAKTHHHSHAKETMSPEEVVSSLLHLAQTALAAGDHESAATSYASVLQLGDNAVALYNLGSLYAHGLGVRQDYMEAARLFRRAELLGNARAGKLCQKCMLDYMIADLADKSPADLYAMMAVFVSKVYPEADHKKAEVKNGLIAVALTNRRRGDEAGASKLFQAAEYADIGEA